MDDKIMSLAQHEWMLRQGRDSFLATCPLTQSNKNSFGKSYCMLQINLFEKQKSPTLLETQTVPFKHQGTFF